MTLLETRTRNIQKSYEPFRYADDSLFSRQDNKDRLEQLVQEASQDLTPAQTQRLVSEFFGWGPLEVLFARAEIREICVQSQHTIYFETQNGFQRHSDAFLSALTFRNFIERLCQAGQCHYTLHRPYSNGRFQNFRFHIAAPPIVENPHITFRRHFSHPLEIDSYLSDGICNAEQLELLHQLVDEEKNLLVVGNTGSGKTTLLNSLIQKLRTTRLLLIEDTPELRAPNALCVPLLTHQNLDRSIDQGELLRQCLRMRPDRLIMGEIRGVEAKDLLQALATGHHGSMGTLHADSCQQALYRLEMLVQMGAPQWSLDAVRRLLQLSLQYVVLIQKQKGLRKIEGIYEICGLEDFGFLVAKRA